MRLRGMFATIASSMSLLAPGAYAATEACPDTPPTIIKPATGRTLIGFADKLPSGKTSQGSLIETSGSATVAAPGTGRVKFADVYRSFGLTIILDLGCDREISIVGAERSSVSTGDTVERGASIGTMPAAGPGNAPVLYLELREHGRPIDPRL
jgi:murein hydrolase activator